MNFRCGNLRKIKASRRQKTQTHIGRGPVSDAMPNIVRSAIKTYLSIFGGAMPGLYLSGRFSADLALPGVLLGGFLGWVLVGRKSRKDTGETDQETDAGRDDDDGG